MFDLINVFTIYFSMQAVAAAAGGGSLQHSSGLQHHAGGPSMQHRGHPMQHSMMATGAQVPAASQVTSGESGQREQGDVPGHQTGPQESQTSPGILCIFI